MHETILDLIGESGYQVYKLIRSVEMCSRDWSALENPKSMEDYYF